MRSLIGPALGSGLLMCLVAGCAPSGPKRQFADVAGKVSYKGTPLTAGTVVFQPKTGPFTSGEIQSDGTYTLKGEIGLNKVTIVNNESPLPSTPEEAKKFREAAAKKVQFPLKYSGPESDLSFEVKAGKNTADFDLK